jgi:hypothetical protein
MLARLLRIGRDSIECDLEDASSFLCLGLGNKIIGNQG